MVPTEVLRAIQQHDPRTGKPIVLCIDADCPSCGWPERNFDTGTHLFGCRKCSYTSTKRNS